MEFVFFEKVALKKEKTDIMFSWRKVHDMQEVTDLGSFSVTKVHCAELVVAAGMSPPAGQRRHHLHCILLSNVYLFT